MVNNWLWASDISSVFQFQKSDHYTQHLLRPRTSAAKASRNLSLLQIETAATTNDEKGSCRAPHGTSRDSCGYCPGCIYTTRSSWAGYQANSTDFIGVEPTRIFDITKQANLHLQETPCFCFAHQSRTIQFRTFELPILMIVYFAYCLQTAS
ncbi:hypothetical protein GQ43DRAFT_271655 [Delitschia confertaspora ATCC 74209]|uniref:Uncharacterized protein n=1 Tax=Delitschia confertaspora ATCC 74209 TaxID=1513339 RepID=A0A9P4JBG5_9PLEO|nr:hypothetical protein GQ43DRAFT_271655 [Delitschia confertaspora ATCC 74209]